LMRVLRSVIASSPAFMATGQPKLTGGRAVGSKIVGHKLVQNKGHFLEQFPPAWFSQSSFLRAAKAFF
jgi:hypothetical protein